MPADCSSRLEERSPEEGRHRGGTSGGPAAEDRAITEAGLVLWRRISELGFPGRGFPGRGRLGPPGRSFSGADFFPGALLPGDKAG